MWRISLRDLQWRLRRFVVAVLAAGLVLALTLLLSGALTGIRREPACPSRCPAVSSCV